MRSPSFFNSVSKDTSEEVMPSPLISSSYSLGDVPFPENTVLTIPIAYKKKGKPPSKQVVYQKINRLKVKKTTGDGNCVLHAITGTEIKGVTENLEADKLRQDIVNILNLYSSFDAMPPWLGSLFFNDVGFDYHKLSMSKKKAFYKKYKSKMLSRSRWFSSGLYQLLAILAERDVFVIIGNNDPWCRQAYSGAQPCACQVCQFNKDEETESWNRALGKMLLTAVKSDPQTKQEIQKLLGEKKLSLSKAWVNSKKSSSITITHQYNHMSQVEGEFPEGFRNLLLMLSPVAIGGSFKEASLSAQVQQNIFLAWWEKMIQFLKKLFIKIIQFFLQLLIKIIKFFFPQKCSAKEKEGAVLKTNNNNSENLFKRKECKKKLVELNVLQSLDKQWFDTMIAEDYRRQANNFPLFVNSLKNLATALTTPPPTKSYRGTYINSYKLITPFLKKIIRQYNNQTFTENHLNEIKNELIEIKNNRFIREDERAPPYVQAFYSFEQEIASFSLTKVPQPREFEPSLRRNEESTTSHSFR